MWEADAVELPDGRRIRCRSLRRPAGGPDPQLGVYLTARDPGPRPWETRWVRWRDFRVPASTAEAVATLREAHTRAAAELVEVACPGGVGRTGTALALLAVMSGVPAEEAVAWARAHHHPRAAETPGQRRWVRRAARLL